MEITKQEIQKIKEDIHKLNACIQWLLYKDEMKDENLWKALEEINKSDGTITFESDFEPN
jgi:hypothetical protein